MTLTTASLLRPAKPNAKFPSPLASTRLGGPPTPSPVTWQGYSRGDLLLNLLAGLLGLLAGVQVQVRVRMRVRVRVGVRVGVVLGQAGHLQPHHGVRGERVQLRQLGLHGGLGCGHGVHGSGVRTWAGGWGRGRCRGPEGA